MQGPGVEKKCRYCERTLPIEKFNRWSSARDGHRYYCRDCAAERKLLSRYGLTLPQFRGMLQSQGFACVICRVIFIEVMPVVDHDHRTNQVRGILCQKCNAGLGMFSDDPEVLEIAAEYIRVHS